MRYEKGRKDASRQRIIEVAAKRFRRDGIAASGLASVMQDAGLTNGAFYPHFESKSVLVRECVGANLDEQMLRLQAAFAKGGIEAVFARYLSKEHRDNPGNGCVSAALLPELARQPEETRSLYAERFDALVRQMASSLPSHVKDKEATALSVYATLIGALQLARAVQGTKLSDRILSSAAKAASKLIAEPNRPKRLQ